MKTALKSREVPQLRTADPNSISGLMLEKRKTVRIMALVLGVAGLILTFWATGSAPFDRTTVWPWVKVMAAMSCLVLSILVRHNRNWWLLPFIEGLVFMAVGDVMVFSGGSASHEIATAVLVGGMLALASGIIGAFSRAGLEQQSS